MVATFLKDILSLKKNPLTELPNSISQPKTKIDIIKKFYNKNDPKNKNNKNTTASSKPSEKLDLNLFHGQEFPAPDSSLPLVRLENGGLVEELHVEEPHGLLAPGSVISEPENFVTSGSKWFQPGGLGSPVTITYSYSNLLDGTLGISSAQLTSAIEEALGLWAKYAPLHFVEVADIGPTPSDAKYNANGHPDIRFGHHHIDGSGKTLAHAYYPFSTTDGLAGDVHFDSGDSWSINPKHGFDILEVAVHEIGHALGLGHENTNTAILNPLYGRRYSGLGTSFLFQDDINGIRAIYGAGTGSVSRKQLLALQRWATQQGSFSDTQQWFVGDFNGDGKDDVGKSFDQLGLGSIDVYLSNGSSLALQRWGTQQGGFWDTQRWFVGDFNGDGRDDAGKAFNHDGLSSIDVHLSNGSSLALQRWTTQQGSFSDTQQWFVGDFNGDGRDDVGKAFDELGLSSIDVYLSNGSSLALQRWATQQGSFSDTQQWFVGDFNGDGRDDVGKAFDEFGLSSIDVYLSNGSSLALQRWATQQGSFSDTQQWFVGDFNGDGRDDVGKAFDEFGLSSIDVYLSNGSSLALQRWGTRQGGFWDAQQWLAGDFNGDGRDDAGKAFNHDGLSSIDVHLAI